jgi:hypothetical protein
VGPHPAAAHTTTERFYTFSDLSTIKQLASELDRDVPLKKVLRSLLAEHQGQLQLDFHASVTTPAKVVSLPGRHARKTPDRAGNPIAAGNAVPVFRSPGRARAQVLHRRLAPRRRRRAEDGRRGGGLPPRAGDRSELVPAIVNLANIHYAQDELIEAQALYERRHRPRPGLLRGALQPRQHPPRSRPLRRRAGLLPRRRGAEPRLSRTRTSTSR